MKAAGPENGNRIAIPGVPGKAIAAALNRMAMHSGEMVLTIQKRRQPGGGYVYLIGSNTPDGPAAIT